MKHLLTRISGWLAALLAALALLPTPIFAAINPATGDPSERIMGWVFIALGTSLIVIIILFMILGKKRGD